LLKFILKLFQTGERIKKEKLNPNLLSGAIEFSSPGQERRMNVEKFLLSLPF